MFALFFSLYYSMFTGTWQNFSNVNTIFVSDAIQKELNMFGNLITSIFGDHTALTDVGTQFATAGGPGYFSLISLILATITSIGIVVVVTKGIKKLFTVFFYGVR